MNADFHRQEKIETVAHSPMVCIVHHRATEDTEKTKEKLCALCYSVVKFIGFPWHCYTGKKSAFIRVHPRPKSYTCLRTDTRLTHNRVII